MPPAQISFERTIPAPAPVLFGIVADPHMHHRIDGGGTVRDAAVGPHRLTSVGDSFGMRMKVGPIPYTVTSKVVEFEEGRLLAWAHFGGHRWRWEFEPLADDSTLTRHTYVYGLSPVPKALELLGFVDAARKGMPESLANLERVALEA